jgi:hypothetical protein
MWCACAYHHILVWHVCMHFTLYYSSKRHLTSFPSFKETPCMPQTERWNPRTHHCPRSSRQTIRTLRFIPQRTPLCILGWPSIRSLCTLSIHPHPPCRYHVHAHWR